MPSLASSRRRTVWALVVGALVMVTGDLIAYTLNLVVRFGDFIAELGLGFRGVELKHSLLNHPGFMVAGLLCVDRSAGALSAGSESSP